MNLDVEYLARISTPVLLGFDRVEPKQWGQQGIVLELMTEIGSLGRALTIWEGYRHGRKSKHQMGDELSDILFVLIKLAREEGVELSTKLETPMINSPVYTHWSLMCSATHIPSACEEHYGMGGSPRIKQIIREMMSLVGSLAEHYNVDLKHVHEEEMRVASLWQRIFFDAKGVKRKHLIFWRKVVWFFMLRWHKRAVEHM